MEIKKAKNHFQHGISCDIFTEPVASYARMAVKALEKQIPQQIRIIHSGKTYCPVCGMLLENYKSISEKPPYCKHCGQALSWDVEYKEITLEKATELLRFEYEWAEQQKLIGDPLTHALNKVWNVVTETKR